MNRVNQRTLGGDVAGFVVITLPQGIELPAGDCGKFTVAETHQRELGQKATSQAVRHAGVASDGFPVWFHRFTPSLFGTGQRPVIEDMADNLI
jgi:hypothetical protein